MEKDKGAEGGKGRPSAGSGAFSGKCLGRGIAGHRVADCRKTSAADEECIQKELKQKAISF